MVSVLALNKLELRDMITAEMVENPVLEELEDSVPLIDDVDRREETATALPSKKAPRPLPTRRRKIRSKRSISVRSFRIISIPAIAVPVKWRTSNARRSRIFYPSPVR
jgi:DNA-directed RNA polymerase specialized sigma54-like protein